MPPRKRNQGRKTETAKGPKIDTVLGKPPVSVEPAAPDFRDKAHPTYYTSSVTVAEMEALCEYWHGLQKDKINRPYIEHLRGVLAGVQVLGGDVEEQIAALGHDLIEDCKKGGIDKQPETVTRTMLREYGVSEVAVLIIEAVTKPVGIAQKDFLATIIKAGKGACRVKAADTLNNLRHDRLAEVTRLKGQYVTDRLLKKYKPFLAALLMELDLIMDTDGQKKLATVPAGSYTTTTTGKSNYYAYSSLIGGDWPTAWNAPILKRTLIPSPDNDTKLDASEFLLADGSVRVEKHYWSKSAKDAAKISVYTMSTWEKDPKITFYGVTDDDIADYIQILNDHNIGLGSQSYDTESTAGWWSENGYPNEY